MSITPFNIFPNLSRTRVLFYFREIPSIQYAKMFTHSFRIPMMRYGQILNGDSFHRSQRIDLAKETADHHLVIFIRIFSRHRRNRNIFSQEIGDRRIHSPRTDNSTNHRRLYNSILHGNIRNIVVAQSFNNRSAKIQKTEKESYIGIALQMNILEIDIFKLNRRIICLNDKRGIIAIFFRYIAKSTHRIRFAIPAPNDDFPVQGAKNNRIELSIAFLRRFVIATEVDIRRQEETHDRGILLVDKLIQGFVNSLLSSVFRANPESAACFTFGRLIAGLLLRQLHVVFAVVPDSCSKSYP